MKLGLGLSLGSGSGAAALTATYWQLNITGSTGQYVGADEIEFRATPGGADQATGGTAFASESFAGLPASAAFDGTAAEWASNGGAMPIKIGYQFATPVSVQQVSYKPRTGNNSVEQSPTAFDVQYSSDGVSYTTLFSASGITWPTDAAQLFTAS